MSLQALKETIGNHGKDVRLNLGSVLSIEGAPGLTLNQILGVGLSCAYSTKCAPVIEAIHAEASGTLTAEEIHAAKSAATIMAMNNVYYRSLHLAEDAELMKLPAKLRMNVIGNPGIPKADFELYSLAVSAISGCGMCIKSHVNEARKNGLSGEGIQSTIRIAAVVNSAAQAIVIA
jgi:alkyl hydroperoxide reductase subunit D